MRNIFIFGTGGVGSVYGWLMQQAGAKVTAACRSNYLQVKNHGLRIRSAKWGSQLFSPNTVSSVHEASKYGPFDYIIVCSKAFPDTASLIKEAVTPDTTIVLAQNGIDIEEAYAKLYPGVTIISGVVYLPVVQVELGVVEHGTPLERFEVGLYPASNTSDSCKSKLTGFTDLWNKSGGTIVTHDDIQGPRWNKLALNATLNSVCALTLCDDANFLRSSNGALGMASEIMREVGKVATAAGYPNMITDESIAEHMKRHTDRLRSGGKEPSMLQDVRAGRPIEVEAILGNLVRRATKLNVSIPHLRLLYVLATGLNFSLNKSAEWGALATVP